MLRGSTVLFALLCITGHSVHAVPITYIFSASGSGSLGANAFVDTPFTIVSTADTSQITGSPGLYRVDDLTAAVTVTGIGSANFAIATINVSNQGATRVGFSDPGQNLAILFVVDQPAIATYDLSTAIGPLQGPPAFNPGASFATTAGGFILNNVGTTTFQAVLVPEPAAIGLASICTALALMVRRRATSARWLHVG